MLELRRRQTGDLNEIFVSVKICKNSSEIIQGAMPRRALALILEWASVHRAELLEDWKLCKENQSPKKISPLE